MSDGLERFRRAQDAGHAGFASALAEIESGGKTGHWIWYVFPQLAGLGQSDMAQSFGIRGPEEASAYLHDAVLRGRLIAITRAVADQLAGGAGKPLRRLMGSDVDARKLVSSLTLFGRVAGELYSSEGGDQYRELASLAETVLARAEAEGYQPCGFTLGRLQW